MCLPLEFIIQREEASDKLFTLIQVLQQEHQGR